MESPETAWNTVYCVRPYNPHRIDGHRNPAFDRVLDGRLLDFKEGQYYAIRAETKVFRTAIAALILPSNVLVSVVPGHRARATNADQPLTWAAEELAAFDPRLKLRTDCLVRAVDIPRLASGGERTVATHLRSIVVTSDVAGAMVLVLDDVVTTGQSIEAVRQLLEHAGAARVAAVALARTMRYQGLAA